MFGAGTESFKSLISVCYRKYNLGEDVISKVSLDSNALEKRTSNEAPKTSSWWIGRAL